MKKLNKAKWFSLGLAVVLVLSLLIVPGVAANMSTQATLNYRDVKITLDGTTITPTDASGNAVEPFIIDGTTYLPVRGIASALGLGVEWDRATSTVKLTAGLSSSAPQTASGSFTLGAGQYIVGEDVTAGKYNCVAVDGYGILSGEVASLGYVGLFEVLGAEDELLEAATSYSNLRLADGDVFTIGGNLIIEFTAK